VRTPRPSDQSGFTLVEVLVASLVLVLGVMVTFTLIDAATKANGANTARTAATNLARELIEYSRGTDYDELQPATLETALRERTPVAGTGTAVWRIQRRGVNYTVAESVCTFDDPKDGLATTPPENPCPAAAAIPGVTNDDTNPDDFRRVTFQLTWRLRGGTNSMTQHALIVNPAGGLGPRITAFDAPATQMTGDTVSWGGASGRNLTTTNATVVHWTAGEVSGDAGGGPNNWNFTWSLGSTVGKLAPLTVDGTWVLDGAYTVQAQAKDSRGVAGEAKMVTVHVNRHPPAAPLGLAGGFNKRFGGGIVDMHWQAYPEGDLTGYTVSRLSDGQVICTLDPTVRSCTDPNPPNVLPVETYLVSATDCADAKTGTNCSRAGTAATLVVPLIDTAAPSEPQNLVATTVDGLPVLTWTAPASGTPIFYRIYRDTGTNLADRYDETLTDQTTYTDPRPGASTVHQYWVTAVGSDFQESGPSNDATSTPAP
jgi:prepilin-type N-terminal cleavage/methylation domain-containing protein